jgi:hypothetical protein
LKHSEIRITLASAHILKGPAGRQGEGPNDKRDFFREKIGKVGLLRPFHLIDAEFADGLFIEKGKNEKEDS